MRHAFFQLPKPIVLGHRGAAGHAPENTLVSFAKSLELGATVIESDIHLTRDGEPVLLHDPSVDRTTSGSGGVADLELRELKQFDAGYHFDPERRGAFPHRGKGITVPTLAESFEEFPEARFNLEIKSFAPTAAAAVLELIERFDRADRTLVTAGEDSIMAKLRTTLAQSSVRPAIGACTADIAAFARAARDGGDPPDHVMALQIPDEFSGQALFTPRLLHYAHAHDVEVHVWTINEPAEIYRLIGLEADGIVSDFPDRVVAVAREYAELNPRA